MRIACRFAAVAMFWLPAAVLLAAEKTDGDAALTYERNVRPILKAQCFACHGEGEELEGGLDVRLRRLIVAGGESGAAIVPGKLDESLLYEKIVEGEMPPGDKKLSAEEIAILGRWILQGAMTAQPEPDKIALGWQITAADRRFWSFRPISNPQVPQVKAAQSVRNPIDAFLLTRLEEDQLSFSPEADKTTLMRRAYFDLTGLPPTPKEVELFLSDTGSGAYDRLIDRLLASPHYGERWGRYWLDVAGYADSEGYTNKDIERKYSYKYRDYVIRSHNADKPMDQFIIEQLAGDELVAQPYKNLEPSDIEKLTATGFLRTAPDGTGSSGIDESVARNQVMADTIHIVSTSLLGLSVQCAQCHHHRYDPISHSDYFRIRAIFEPSYDWKQWRTRSARLISLYTDQDRQQSATIEAEAVKIEAERKVKEDAYIQRALNTELAKLPETLREPLRRAHGTPAKDRTDEQKKLLKTHPSVNVTAGSLYLYDREIDVEARKLDDQRKTKEKQWVRETYERELTKVPEAQREAVRAAVAAVAAKRTAEQIALLQEYPLQLITLATLAKYNSEAATAIKEMTKRAAAIRASKAVPELKKYSDRAAEIRGTKKVEEFVRVLSEVPGRLPTTYRFDRGDHDQPKEAVAPGGLQILAKATKGELPTNDPSVSTSGRRLAWAQRLTDGEHPLTARVLANRVWMHHFGRGIVDTPGDFGELGSRPTHPELLDFLARDLMQGGWRLKRLHKLIMTSSAYRQSSRRTAALDAIDPDNRLYARMSVRRLEAEAVRDAILTASGKLNVKMFGPPIPVMEDEVGQFVVGIENKNGENRQVVDLPLHGEEFRRSVYVQVRRSRPLAVLDTFDAPAMDPNCARRSSSTVAPQSLMLMNSRFLMTYTRHFAAHVRQAVGDNPRRQVAAVWLRAYGSEPSEEEITTALAFLEAQAKQFLQTPPVASKPRAKAPDVKLEPLANFCQALLSSNRFLYID